MTWSVRDPLFKGCFRVIVGDYGKVDRYLRAKGVDADNLGGPKLAKAIEEVLHACMFVLRNRGLTDRTILDEVGNYYVKWLVHAITKRVGGRGRRR